jgi:diguanylate cyclase (GGDEF)-like protein
MFRAIPATQADAFAELWIRLSRIESNLAGTCHNVFAPIALVRRLQLRTSLKLLIALSSGLALVQIAASCLLPPGLALTTVSDTVLGLQFLGLLIASIQNSVATHDRLRSFWTLQALCWCFWLTDQIGWAYYDIVLRSPVPDLYLGDFLPFMSAVPILAGLLLRPHVEPSQTSIRFGIFDFLQLMLWWVFIYVYCVVCWQYVFVNVDAYNRNYDRISVVQALAIGFVLALLLFRSAGKWRRFYALFLGAFAFFSLALQAVNHAFETGTYSNGNWFDALISISLVPFMLLTAIGRDLTASPKGSRNGRFTAGTAYLAVAAVLSLPLFLIATVLNPSVPPLIFRYRVIVVSITMIVMTDLLLRRQRRLHQDLRRVNKALEETSLTDPLTGIHNRRYFEAAVERDEAQSFGVYSSPRDLVFYMIDLDNFKQINDLFGHNAGDRVLIDMTRRIGSIIRDSDVLLRWGGEEFLIVSRVDRRNAPALAKHVLQAARETPFEIDETRRIDCTCSVGWAAFPRTQDDRAALGYDQIISLADQALRKAKNTGKNCAFGIFPAETEDDSPEGQAASVSCLNEEEWSAACTAHAEQGQSSTAF